MRTIKTYSELILLPTFQERFEYLSLAGTVGARTFGGSRHLNQTLYLSQEWKEFRRQVILRDMGFDLGLRGYPIYDKITVHHINPITEEDILERNR